MNQPYTDCFGKPVPDLATAIENLREIWEAHWQHEFLPSAIIDVLEMWDREHSTEVTS